MTNVKKIRSYEQFVEESINESNGQTVKEFGDLLALLLDKENGLDIERAINALKPKEAKTLEKQISTLYKKLFKLTNDGFGLRGTNEGMEINEAASLIDEETGKAVKLPYKTKDFRGDPITVKGFTEPHKSSSSGRIQTDQGEFFPGVAGLKIVGHQFESVNEGHRLQGVWDYCIADPMGTRVFKKFGISPDDANEIQEICYDVMKRVGDKGSVVSGGGLEINGKPFLRNYSMGNLGPEEIYSKVIKLLNKKYPKLKVTQKWGNMN